MFSDSELALILKYGAWYQALAEGTIVPETAAQKHFVECSQWKSDPRTRHEKAWRTYMKHLTKEGKLPVEPTAHHKGMWHPSRFEGKTDTIIHCHYPHQVTGGVVDQDGENFDPTAIH